jgi:hypothetical protein
VAVPLLKLQDAVCLVELLCFALLFTVLCVVMLLQEGRTGKFLTGDKITHGDIAVFCNLSTLQSGWLDGERLWEGGGEFCELAMHHCQVVVSKVKW